MPPLTYEYNSSTRDELAQFAREIALAIDLDWLSAPKGVPPVICVTGPKDAGKSIFWDEMKDALLGDSAVVDPYDSMDLVTKDRIYETWKGHDSRTRKSLKIFFCNISSTYFDMEDGRIRRELIDLEDHPFPRWTGDLIIASNGILPTVSLMIKMQQTRQRDGWGRKTRIIAVDPRFENLSPFQNLPVCSAAR